MLNTYCIEFTYEVQTAQVFFDRGFREEMPEYDEQEGCEDIRARNLSEAVRKLASIEVKKNVTLLKAFSVSRNGGRVHRIDAEL